MADAPTPEASNDPLAKLQVQTQMAFSTPLVAGIVEGADSFNTDLQAKILEIRQQDTGQQKSNVGGWHSKPDLLQKVGEPYAGSLARMFLKLISAAMQSLKVPVQTQGNQMIEAWANVNEKGDSNRPHIHPGCPWSGVYYVATEQGKSGELRFTDPRPGALMVHHALSPWNSLNNVRVDPQPGMMVVFPSFLYHAVENYQGSNARISIALNLR